MQEKCVCRQAVTSRTADLLVVGNEVLGQLEVDDETDVRLVIAHPKLDRCSQNSRLPLDEAPQILFICTNATIVLTHAREIWEDRDSLTRKEFGNRQTIGMGEAVDDALSFGQDLVFRENLRKPRKSLLTGLRRIDLDC